MFEIQALMEGHVVCQNSLMYTYEVDLDKWREMRERKLVGEKSPLHLLFHGFRISGQSVPFVNECLQH